MAPQAPESDRTPAGSGAFTTTHWSVVLQAARQGSPEAQQALERLCRSYRYPLYLHVRRLGWGPEDAEDLTQQFLARFLDRSLPRADPARGRFRSLLLTSLKNFLADEWDKIRAQKRGSGQAPISWEGVDPEEKYRLEPVGALTPDMAYDKRWAAMLLDGVLGQLRSKYEAIGRLREFDLLKGFVWGDSQAGTYAEVAAQLDMQDGTFKVAVHRLRKQFQEQLRQEIRRTVSAPEEVDEELRYLRSLFSS